MATDANALIYNYRTPTTAPRQATGAKIVREAETFLGVPYVWDGLSRLGVDCSGLVKLVFQRFGVNLPHLAAGQAKYGVRVSRKNLKPGDLLFFGAQKNPHHVAIYAGNGQMIEAPEQGVPVRITPVRAFSQARRLVASSSRNGSPAATALAPGNTVLGQVERQIGDDRVRLAMLMAPFLEGGGKNPLGAGGWGTGDGGVSGGAYQINTSAHPGVTLAQTRNPRFAVRYMKGAYKRAVASVPNALWKRNPTLAAEKAIQRAEIPAESYYASHGTGSVKMAYRDAVRADQNAGLAAGLTGTGGGATATETASFSASTALHILSPITLLPSLAGSAGQGFTSSIVGWVGPLLIKGLFVMFGGGMVVLGGFVAASHTAPGKLAETAAL